MKIMQIYAYYIENLCRAHDFFIILLKIYAIR